MEATLLRATLAMAEGYRGCHRVLRAKVMHGLHCHQFSKMYPMETLVDCYVLST
jgi:hypothetical protein